MRDTSNVDNHDDGEHSKEIQKIISPDMGSVQRWGLPLLMAVIVVCLLLLFFLRIPVAGAHDGSQRLIFLLIQSL